MREPEKDGQSFEPCSLRSCASGPLRTRERHGRHREVRKVAAWGLFWRSGLCAGMVSHAPVFPIAFGSSVAHRLHVLHVRSTPPRKPELPRATPPGTPPLVHPAHPSAPLLRHKMLPSPTAPNESFCCRVPRYPSCPAPSAPTIPSIPTNHHSFPPYHLRIGPLGDDILFIRISHSAA